MSRVMIIAGTDSSGGAGLARDTIVAGMLGFQVSPVVTAVTAQTNSTVTKIALMAPDMVVAQIKAALECAAPQAIKIGMLGSQRIAEAVAETLALRPAPIVLDPVIRSSSGTRLLSGELPAGLGALADLVTPNLPEAAILTGRNTAQSDAEIARQARILMARGIRAVLIKGGHGRGTTSVDHLFDDTGHEQYSAPMLSTGKRGTGCTLATAIACYLAQGQNLSSACHLAKCFTHRWLDDMSGFTSLPNGCRDSPSRDSYPGWR